MSASLVPQAVKRDAQVSVPTVSESRSNAAFRPSDWLVCDSIKRTAMPARRFRRFPNETVMRAVSIVRSIRWGILAHGGDGAVPIVLALHDVFGAEPTCISFGSGSGTMRIDSHRFGTLELNADQLFLFPHGLIGMETLHQWALIPDPENDCVAWLQSAARGDRTLAVISPRAFFPDYRVHVGRRDLAALHLNSGAEVYIMTTVAGHVGNLTTNLRAPLLVNLDRRLGCQIITNDDRPIRQPLPVTAASADAPLPIRRAA